MKKIFLDLKREKFFSFEKFGFGRKKDKPSFIETFQMLFVVIALSVVFRSCLFEPFYIPSGSMKPNLVEGDYIFVSKFSYGYSRYSIPFGYYFDYFDGRVLSSEPKRGDVVVFRLPAAPSINYIKRLVGMPGDKIQVKEGRLYINGEEVDKEYFGEFLNKPKNTQIFERSKIKKEMMISEMTNLVSTYEEKFSLEMTGDKEKKYFVLDSEIDGIADNTMVYEVPENHYFFMGDNRDMSKDSRFPDVGFIESKYIIGKAKVVFFSSSEPVWKIWKWHNSIRFGRIFNKI